MKKLVAQMNHLSSKCHSDRMEYDIYMDVYHEWLKLMKPLGKCVSLGFNDLIHKANCMENNRELLCEEFGLTDVKTEYITDFIMLERFYGLH